MIEVSDEFKELWHQKQGKLELSRILYNRRYWNGAAFVWEFDESDSDDWHVLEEDEFVDFGDIPMELDTPNENVFRTSVVSIFLENTENQWIQSAASPSMWAADGVAASGYKLHRSIFRLQRGLELNDGTIEWVTIFTGFAIRPRLTGSSGVAEIILASKSAYRLEKSNAEEVSEEFTLENCSPATGDGTNTDFVSTSTGVDRITDVQVNAVSEDEDDFSVANLNKVAVPGNTGKAEITIDPAPGNTLTVKCSGLRWLRNQLIHVVLGLIAAGAGIPEVEQEIDEVVLLGETAGSQTIDSEAEWAAEATDVNISDAVNPGYIQRKWFLIDNFTDGDYTASPVWTVLSGSAAISSGALALTWSGSGNFPAISTPFAKTTGAWRFRVNPGAATQYVYFFMASSGVGGTGIPSGNGYSIELSSGGALFVRLDAGSRNLLTGVLTVPAAPFEVRVLRNSDGQFRIYFDGVLKATVNDANHTTNAYFMMGAQGGAGTVTIDDIYWSPEEDAAGVPTNADAERTYVFDLLSAPSAMGILQRTQTLNGGSVLYKTAGSDDGITYDTLVELAESGQMQHAPKRYLKIYILITPNGFDSPLVDRVIANFSTTDIFLALAVHSGQTGAAAFERYAGLVDYETGDRASGARFFRSKTVSADPAFEISQEDGILKVTEWDSGEDDVVTVAAVRAGNKFASYSCTDAAEASPNPIDEFGQCLPPGGEVTIPEAYVANNLNIPLGRARSLHDRRHRPLVKMTATIWDVPWAEIGDVGRFSFFDNPLLERSVANDPLLLAGAGNFMAGEAENVLARSLDMKILSYRRLGRTGLAEVRAEEVPA